MNIRREKFIPPADDIFNAFHFTPLHKVKVVILGQDPYHNDGSGTWAVFFCKERSRDIPPSLVNIYQELHDDCGCYIPNNGYLEKWAEQGVLASEHRSDCTRPSGEFPSWELVGNSLQMQQSRLSE